MSNIIAALEKERMQREIPDFGPGDTLVVEVKVKEGDRERTINVMTYFTDLTKLDPAAALAAAAANAMMAAATPKSTRLVLMIRRFLLYLNI